MLDSVIDLIRRVRVWMRPVDDDAIPDLAGHGITAVRLYTGVCVSAIVALLGAAAALPEPERPAWLLWNGSLLVAYVGAFVMSFAEAPRRKPLVLMAAMALGTCLSMSAGPFLGGDAGLLVYTPAVPLLIASVVPWRPMCSIAFIPIVIAAPLLAFEILGDDFPVHGVVYGVIATTLCVAAALVNQLQRRLRSRLHSTHEKLLAMERMSSLGRMTAGIAHELKTPLAAARNDLAQVSALAEELGASFEHPEVTESDLREILGELLVASKESYRGLERATNFISAIRNHTIVASEAGGTFSVAERVREVELLLAHRLKQSAVTLSLHADEDVTLEGSPGRFDQVLSNLLSNAVDACEERGSGGRVDVRVRSLEERVEVIVQDDGSGVPEVVRDRIFEPLFTTRGAEKGTGLGLAIALDLVRADFGGTLELADSPQGARFVVRFPRRTTRAAPAPDAWVPALAR